MSSLDTLESNGLIRLAQMEPELEYLFRHALVQEAAYDSILKSDRRNLHLAVARELERLYPERLDELSALLASHYRETDEIQRAYLFYRRAARYAGHKFANHEAEYNLRAALELASTAQEKAEVFHHLGNVVQTLGRLDESVVLLKEALPLYRLENDNLEQIADVYCNLSQAAWGKNDVSESLAIAREGLQEVGELPPSWSYAELLRYVANGCVFNGLVDEAELYIPKVLSIAEQSGSKAAMAQALITLAIIEDCRGKTEQAAATLERAAELGEQANNPFAVSRARNNLSYILGKLGRNLEAAEQYESMIAYNHQANSIFGELWFQSQLVTLYLDLGKIDEAEKMIPVMLELLESSGGKTYRSQAELARLQALIYIGSPEDAIPDLTAERNNCIVHNDKQMAMNDSLVLAQAYVIIKDYDRAVQEMKFGIDNAGVWGGAMFHYLLAGYQARSGMDIEMAYESLAEGDRTRESISLFAENASRLYALMNIRAREGKFEEFLAMADELVSLYESNQFLWSKALTLWEAGSIALEAGNKEQARKLLQNGADEFSRMNIPVFVTQISEILIGL